MTPVKLFAGAALALVATLIAAPTWTRAQHDISIHDRYFIVAGRHLLFLGIFICASSAIAYYACARWLNLSLNGTLAVLHFGCIAFVILAFFWEALMGKRTTDTVSPEHSWAAATNVLLLVLSFILSCVLFGVNVIWALVAKVRKV